MASKFGYHSGDFTAKNIVAGTFIISGAGGTIKQKAINFPRSFHSAPKIIATQNLGSSGSSKYNVSLNVSGASVGNIAISGITTAGFTAVVSFDQNMTEDSNFASGARFDYIAFDFVNKTRK